jgi:hypothetical protein
MIIISFLTSFSFWAAPESQCTISGIRQFIVVQNKWTDASGGVTAAQLTAGRNQ